MRKLKYVKLFENFDNEDFFEDSEWMSMILQNKEKSVKVGNKEFPYITQTKKDPNSFQWFFEPFTLDERKNIYNTSDYRRPENWSILDDKNEENYKYSLVINKLDTNDIKMVSNQGIKRGEKSPFRASITEWKKGGKNHTLLEDFMIKSETISQLIM